MLDKENVPLPVIVPLGMPKTIGELKKLIKDYPNDQSFGFRNQPMQYLYRIEYPGETFVCFQELNGPDFEALARNAIQYLNDNHHPHTTMIITNTSAEVVEGVKAFKTEIYLKD